MSSSTTVHESDVAPILAVGRHDSIKQTALLTTLAVGLILVLGAVLGISMGGVNAYAGLGLLIAAPLLIGDIFLARSLHRRETSLDTHTHVSPPDPDRLENGAYSPQWVEAHITNPPDVKLFDNQHWTGVMKVDDQDVFYVCYKKVDLEKTTLYFPARGALLDFMTLNLPDSLDRLQLMTDSFPGIPLSDGQMRHGTIFTPGKRVTYYWFIWKEPGKPVVPRVFDSLILCLTQQEYLLPRYWNLTFLDRALHALKDKERLDKKLTTEKQCWPATIHGYPILFVHNGKTIVVQKGHSTDGLVNVKPNQPD
ncbi:MAG: hypothetical protein S4CHLAM2_16230 [Chlamydiales bacterium]|nr:hypothetical protein [Chlamydiales bacterium]